MGETPNKHPVSEKLKRVRIVYGAPRSALIIDLDHFKHINDTLGHPVGDDVIRHVSVLIVEQVRAEDTAVRYVARNSSCWRTTDIRDATALGERMREDIAGNSILLPDGRRLAVTASLGVATFALDETSAEFIRRADAALYLAKEAGRKRTCQADGEHRRTAA